MRLTNTFTGKKDGIRAHCAPRSTPLWLPLRHNRPLPAPSRLLPPLTSPSRALGTLAKLTSVTEITAAGPYLAEMYEPVNRNRNAANSPQDGARVRQGSRSVKEMPAEALVMASDIKAAA